MKPIPVGSLVRISKAGERFYWSSKFGIGLVLEQKVWWSKRGCSYRVRWSDGTITENMERTEIKYAK